MNIEEFRKIVWSYYQAHGRELPWRASGLQAYEILVSEVMLQQTQVRRVIPKYESFLRRFPTLKELAEAPLGEVLAEWGGLGYNRRAKYLHDAAKHLAKIAEPWKIEDLAACKGIGKNTAAAVLVYTYNEPHVFVETNVRTVYIHHFYKDKEGVSDSELSEVIEVTLDRENPREFYYALMDYGTYLKSTVGNVSRASRHYTRQSAFHGSRRQIRGKVLGLLREGPLKRAQIAAEIADERLENVLAELLMERLITEKDGLLYLG